MIFQIKFYYGALINGKSIYSTKFELEDAKKIPSDMSGKLEDMFKKQISALIKNDGFNPDDFEFSFLTKEQYENRYCPEDEIVRSFSVKKQD